MNKKWKLSPIYVPNDACGISDWIPPLDASYSSINTNSWFDMKISFNPDPLPLTEYYVDAPLIPDKSFQQQMKTIRRRKLDKEPSFLCTKKVRIYPTDEQKIILDEWFMAATKMFNITITYIRAGIFAYHELIDLSCANDYLQKTDFRYNLKDDRDKIIKSMKYPIVGHLLDEIINQAVSNYKACITNLQNGNIKKFKIKTWSYKRRKYILKIESNLFAHGTFCARTFKYIESSEPLVDIEHTSTLQLDRDTGKYILFVPLSIEEKEYVANNLDCGIDLGVRTFATVYSNNNVLSIGNKFKRIKSCHKKIDKINELLQLKQKESFVIKRTVETKTIKVNGKDKIIKQKKETILPKTIKRSSLRKALRKYHRKIRNCVKDMHYKVAYHLVTNYYLETCITCRVSKIVIVKSLNLHCMQI